MRGKRKSYGFYGEADGAQRRCGELDPGGDAYNCIINGNYAAAYFTLARLRVIIGIGALVIAHLKRMGAPAEPAAPKRPRTRNAGLTEYEMKIPAGSHVRSGGDFHFVFGQSRIARPRAFGCGGLCGRAHPFQMCDDERANANDDAQPRQREIRRGIIAVDDAVIRVAAGIQFAAASLSPVSFSIKSIAFALSSHRN